MRVTRCETASVSRLGVKMANGVFTRSSKLPANVLKIHMLMLDVCWIV